MRLADKPFDKIKNGTKTIEIRLYDEKRKKVNIGDTICFINTVDTKISILALVTDIQIFKSFSDLYKSLPLQELGYGIDEIKMASPKDMEVFYSLEEQKKYDVVGFRLEVIA